jgi:IS5 family transposase
LRNSAVVIPWDGSILEDCDGDTVVADALTCGDEKVVWADAAYDTHARRARLRALGQKPRIARRANKHHRQLPPRLQRLNKLIARRRAAVEMTFATWKNRSASPPSATSVSPRRAPKSC